MTSDDNTKMRADGYDERIEPGMAFEFYKQGKNRKEWPRARGAAGVACKPSVEEDLRRLRSWRFSHIAQYAN